MSHPSIFSYTITVPESAIDDYGHANNVIYLQWMQDAAIQHANAVRYEPEEDRGWFAREHHIRYLSPALLGEEIEVRTWLSEVKRVRLRRNYEFVRRSHGKVVSSGETVWVYVDTKTGRPVSIPAALQEALPAVRGRSDSPLTRL